VNRAQKQTSDEPGQDSFLDIVANLVGILIILVMVVGARAKDALLEAAPVAETASAAADPAAELASAMKAAGEVEANIHRLSSTIHRQDVEVRYRREERNRVQLLIETAKQDIEQRRSQLDASQQAQFDTQRELIGARAELEDLQLGTKALDHATTTPTVIQHLPTPMAKTVFGKELHFRLSGARITLVPWDELVRQLEREAQQKVWRLKDQPTLTETLGPVGGFWMKYTLKRTETTLPTRSGVSVQQRVELDRFILIPVTDKLGEPLEVALRDDSQFHALLSQHPPESSTVTVWTYPDSFGHFRTLKQSLFHMGYLTACRPLPEGQPIGGSPQGTRSAAE